MSGPGAVKAGTTPPSDPLDGSDSSWFMNSANAISSSAIAAVLQLIRREIATVFIKGFLPGFGRGDTKMNDHVSVLPEG